jgi:predicted nucleotidyltransferase
MSIGEVTRYTSQKQQERISRHQLCEQLEKFGWIASRPDEDLGEDFIVHIYLQGKATGVTFHIQLKSVINLNERRKGNYLVYDDFKVKDLEHWENFSLPVVLMVWDIKLREGRWALIDEVISDLEQRRPFWRENKSTASVHIPWNNTTNDEGLVRLRQGIGHRLFPIITRDKLLEIRMKLEFPNTDEGKAASVAFERAVKEGEPITIQEFIQELNFSEWFISWFGEFDPKKMSISLGPSVSPQTVLVDIGIISTNRDLAAISAIELKAKRGTEFVQLSNEHQNSPLHFLFKIPILAKSYKGTVSIKKNHPGHRVSETRNILRFLDAIAAGGELQLLPLTPDKLPLTISIPANQEMAPDPQYLKIIDKLCVIQDKVSQLIRMPSEEIITGKDVQSINELMMIIEQGKTVTRPKQITWGFKEYALGLILDVHRHGKPCHFTISSPESWVELFESKVQTGCITQHITGKVEMSTAELETAIAKLKPNEYLNLQFVDVEIIEIFPDWFTREAHRLSKLLAEKFGIEAVYLFGSLVWSDVHTPETDIDLAVKGLPQEKFLETVSYLERRSNFPIDLLDWNKAPEHLRQRILTEGKLLYEREPLAAFG